MFKRREQLLGKWVPLEDHITDEVIRLTDGSVMAMFAIEGVSPEAVSAAQINAWHDSLNNTLRNVATAGLILHSYLCRGVADPSTVLPAVTRHGFAEALDIGYRDRLYSNTLYQNDLYLAVQLRPAQPAGAWFAKRVEKHVRSSDSLQGRSYRLERICAQLAADLSEYRPRRLRMVERRGLLFSEIAEALVYAATGNWREVGLTTSRIGDAMFSEDVTFGRETIEMRLPGQTSYGAVLSMREYMAKTVPGMLDGFLSAPFRCTLHQSFRTMEKAEGRDILTRKQNRMVSADDKAHSQIAELEQAADWHESGLFIMGDYSLSLAVFADSLGSGAFLSRLLTAAREFGLGGAGLEVIQHAFEKVAGGASANPLNDVVTAAWKLLGGAGAKVTREAKAMMGAWLSMLPGNELYRPRPGAISSRCFAALAPMHNYPIGAMRGHWGAPIATLRNTAGAAVPFHWHDGDVGNTIITGRTGKGKTLTSGFLLAMTAGRAGVFALDHKRGWELLIRIMGGKYNIAGAGKPLWAPLKGLTNSPRDMEFLLDLVRRCIMSRSSNPMTPEEDRRLPLVLASVMDLPPADRWLEEVCVGLDDGTEREPENPSAADRLRPWCWGNELGWVLDAPQDGFDAVGDLNGFDTTELLKHATARGPAMLYLLYRIARRLNGKPVAVFIDEGWRALQDEVFAPAILLWCRMIRSFNGIIVFITQGAKEIRESGIASALIEQCPNQLHLENQLGEAADYIEGLKLTPEQFDMVRRGLGAGGQRRFLEKKGDRARALALDLTGLDDEIAILSAPQAVLEKLDALPDDVKNDPVRLRQALPELRRQREPEEVE